MNTEEAENTLIDAINRIKEQPEVKQEIKERKEQANERRNRDDFLWFEIILSFSTWGGSQGSKLATDEERFDEVRYDQVLSLDPEERTDHFAEALLDADVRYHEKKSRFLTENVETIKDEGGLEAAQREFKQKDGKEEKIRFLKQLKGIGNKYARNIGMDMYDPDFRDTIAVDNRIKNISEDLGLEFDSYEDEERFYCRVADDVGLEPWELDRLMYNFTEEVRDELKR